MSLENEANIIDCQNQLKNSELFMEVTEEEQENVAGGFNFSMTALNITSYVGNKYQASSGEVNISYSQDSLYTLSYFNMELSADNSRGRGRNNRLPFSPFVYFLRALMWSMNR